MQTDLLSNFEKPNSLEKAEIARIFAIEITDIVNERIEEDIFDRCKIIVFRSISWGRSGMIRIRHKDLFNRSLLDLLKSLPPVNK
jgi:hypothetical protein